MPRSMSRKPISWRYALYFSLVLVNGSIVYAIYTQRPMSDVADMATAIVPLVGVFAVVVLHNELLNEQANSRRLQSRPQVLEYFDRKRLTGNEREKLIVIVRPSTSPRTPASSAAIRPRSRLAARVPAAISPR